MHALYLNRMLIDVTGKFDDKIVTSDERRVTRKNNPFMGLTIGGNERQGRKDE
jgi:hypothetical protein